MYQAIRTVRDKTMRKAAERAAYQKKMAMLLKIIKNLMESMGWTAEQSMDAIGVTEIEKKKLRLLL